MQVFFRSFGDIFSPLRNRNLSIYLSGQVISLFGTFMQATAQSWVVWQISHSTQALGLVAMLGSLPLLVLGAFAGVWADRLERRKLLVGTQVVSMLLAFIFAFLLLTGWIQLWHIYLLSAALGCVSALDMPAQSAFVGDLSGVGQVRKAVVLNNMVVQTSRMVGPALAGWVLGAFGAAPAFWLNGASFLAAIASLLAVRAQQVRRPAGGQKQGEMREAFRFIANEPRIQDLLVMSFLLTFLGYAAAQLLPAIVTDTLHAGPEALGLIMGASGAGALASAFLVVPLVQRAQRPGRVIAGALIWMGAWFSLAVVARTTPLWAAGMFFGSLASPVVNTTCNGLIQETAPANMKARLISIWMMVSFGMLPFGYLLVGYTGQLLGATGAILLNGVILMLGAAGLLTLRAGLRRWQPQAVGQSAD